ncbi:MAG: LytTR family DNA-binding domain-containing protein [Xanthomarina sp.]
MENPFKTIILDDEPFAVELLKDYTQKTASLHLIYAGSDVYEVLELMKTHSQILIFIDLQMPELGGMEIMHMSKQFPHNFIITSAYQEYALEAFKYKVVDFLVKPISYKRFYESVEKYIHWHRSFLTQPKNQDVFIRAERKIYRINPVDIIYIEGLKDYIRIHTENDKIIAHQNMKDIINKLPKADFIRIHRSYIVPINRIKILDGNTIWLIENIQLPIGETYRKTIKDQFNNE